MVLLLYSLAIIDTMTMARNNFEESRDEGVEMPDIGKIKNPLFGQMEFYGANIKFYGRYEGN